jgi:hypothetical protein
VMMNKKFIALSMLMFASAGSLMGMKGGKVEYTHDSKGNIITSESNAGGDNLTSFQMRAIQARDAMANKYTGNLGMIDAIAGTRDVSMKPVKKSYESNNYKNTTKDLGLNDLFKENEMSNQVTNSQPQSYGQRALDFGAQVGSSAYRAAGSAASAVYNAPGRAVSGLKLGNQQFITGTDGSLRSATARLGDNLQNLRQSKSAQQKTTLNADGTRTVNYYDESAGYGSKSNGPSDKFDFFGNRLERNGKSQTDPNTYSNLPARTARSTYKGSQAAYNAVATADGRQQLYQGAKDGSVALYNSAATGARSLADGAYRMITRKPANEAQLTADNLAQLQPTENNRLTTQKILDHFNDTSSETGTMNEWLSSPGSSPSSSRSSSPTQGS